MLILIIPTNLRGKSSATDALGAGTVFCAACDAPRVAGWESAFGVPLTQEEGGQSGGITANRLGPILAPRRANFMVCAGIRDVAVGVSYFDLHVND